MLWRKIATEQKLKKEVKVAVGGTNPIFGVDGSPVVHDMYIEGYTASGVEEGKNGELYYFYLMEEGVLGSQF